MQFFHFCERDGAGHVITPARVTNVRSHIGYKIPHTMGKTTFQGINTSGKL